jgi:hypothetical protein
VAGGLLHVSERDTGIQGGSDERVAEGVGTDRLGDPGLAGGAPDAASLVAVEALSGRAEEDRPFAAFTDREVEGPGGAGRQRDRHDLAALADGGEGPMATLEAEAFDVCAGRFGDPQAVDAQQTDQRVVAVPCETGRDEQRADFVAVESGGVRFVVQAGPADMHRG